jgi:DNA ligase D-like protein (predicted 3'-phosphoesterase)
MGKHQRLGILCVAMVLMLGGCMVSTRNKLRTYHKRRDLTRSGEPAGTVRRRKNKKPLFVVQKHDASHLHYDVRLEIDGVLVSWAVPKGPSMSTRVKRLAMPTDDHPMQYADFEGIIPEGYGAGTVMVWDRGTYKNLKTNSMRECLKEGRIELFFEGEKVQGAFALVRMSAPRKGWLLIKLRDEYANRWPVSARDRERSVLTGRTLRQIEKEEGV